ncbi:hypothetical protein SALBM311S_01945 [Streptomyces alboniger]
MYARSRGLPPSSAASASGALPFLALAPLLLAPVALYASKLYAPKNALRDRAGVGGVRERQRERGLLGAGEGAGRDAGGLAECLRVEPGVLLGLGAQAHRHHERRLEACRCGQLRHFALGTGGAEGFQDAGEFAVVRLVHGLGARCDDRAFGTLGNTDHDRVGPQAGRRGGAESESSHGGEISLPLKCAVAEHGWVDRARQDPRALLRNGLYRAGKAPA